ncbi:MAG: hypothetical protein WBG01_04670 [Bacteroidota bacterium]
MRKSTHTIFIAFLILIGGLITIVPLIYGFSYYATPLEERPFHPQYDTLKPTGILGHGYGIIGSLMIISGVISYTSRKRLRSFARLGKIKYFLEFHIFLCLVGPILILYHTTLKFGGLVSVSFWSMTAVVLSGLVGRYFYIQIPKSIYGNELSAAELEKEKERLGDTFRTTFGMRPEVIKAIDAIALPGKNVAEMSLLEVINFFVFNDLTRKTRLRHLFARLQRSGLRRQAVRQLRVLANHRIVLMRRVAFLQKFKQIFHYWHVIHLPFSIVMFLILFVHVAVALAFGYTWIW